MGTRSVQALLGVFASCLALGVAQAQLDDASKPKHVVNGLTVDITPAIEWSRQHYGNQRTPGGQRPLPYWCPVSGKITNELSWGAWVVVGKVDGQDAAFVLKHPPVAEYKEFTTLKEETAAKRAQLKGRSQKASDKAWDSHREVWRPVTKEEAASGKTGMNKEALHDFDLGMRESISINDEIRRQSKGYDLDKPFPVNCYAMKLRETFNGLPVFDRGTIVAGQTNAPAKPRRTTR